MLRYDDFGREENYPNFEKEYETMVKVLILYRDHFESIWMNLNKSTEAEDKQIFPRFNGFNNNIKYDEKQKSWQFCDFSEIQ